MVKASFSIAFDGYEFYPDHNQVHYQGEITKIEPKIMQVFCLLFEHKGQVLSRDHIAEQLWPDIVVGNEVITRAIFELRKVLNDNPKQARYIETIPRKGYCFIFNGSEDNELPIPSRFIEKSSFLKALLFIGCMLCIVISAYFILIDDNNALSKVHKNKVYQATLFSNGQEKIYSANLSPSWSKALYIKHGSLNGKWQLALKEIANNRTKLLLEDTKKLTSVIWANNDSLAYLARCHNTQCEVLKFDLNKKKFLDSVYVTNSNIVGVALSKDSKVMALSLIEKGRLSVQLLVSNSKENALFIPDAKLSGSYPVFDDEGKKIYFTVISEDGSQAIQSYDIEKQKYRLISTQFSRITSLEFEGDQQLLIAGKAKNSNAIWRLNLTTKAVEQVASIPPSNSAFQLDSNSFSSDLFYLQKHSNFDISAIGLEKQIDFSKLNSHANDLNGLWASIHKSIFFISQRTGNYEVYRYSGDEVIKLTNLYADKIERPILNDDQSKLAFTVLKGNKLKMFVLDIASAEILSEYQIAQTSSLLAWSDDANSVFLSIRSNNVYDIWQYDLKTAQLTKRILASGLVVKQKAHNAGVFYGDLYNKALMFRSEDGSVKVARDFSNIPLLIRPHAIDIDLNTMRAFYIEEGEQVNNLVVSNLFDKEDTSELIFRLDKQKFVTDIGITKTPYVIYDKVDSRTSHLVMLNALEY